MLRRPLALAAVGVLGLAACRETGGRAVGSPSTVTVGATAGTPATVPPESAPASSVVLDHRLVMIGDSLFDRPSSQLRQAFAATDYQLALHAVSGSRWSDHRDEIAAAARDRPAALVVELGTNNVLDGDFTDQDRADIDQAVSTLANNPCVLFVNAGLLNPNRPGLLTDPAWRGYAKQLQALTESNRYLAAALTDHPTLHLFDWDSEFNRHADWSDDLIHVRSASASQYADMMVKQVGDACPLAKA